MIKISIFSRLFKSRAEPKNSLFGSTYSFFFGSTTSGKTVNETTAILTHRVGEVLKQRKYFGDWRKKPCLQYEKNKDCYCIYCGNLAGTREHIPSKVLLDEPYPKNLYTLPACYECNNSFSHDEVYAASVIEILSRITIPNYKRRIGIDKSLEKNPQLKYKIEDEIIYRIEQGLDYKIEISRLDNILLKLAKGHAAFELSEYNFDKYEISIQIFSRDQVLIKEWDRFNGIEELGYANEIGSKFKKRDINT